MARRKLLIAGAISLVVIAGVVLVVIVGGIWFMRSRNRSAGLVHTAVGEPKGAATTQTIGAEGGSVSSPDGRITVEVPPKAVSGSVNFSIQSITNMAPDGLGEAYRLEPNGRTFAVPVKLSFKFSDEDFEGTAREALVVSYQDHGGVWQSMKDPVIDKQNGTYMVETQHFTDYALRKGIHIEPPNQTLRPGQSTYLEVAGCKEAQSVFEIWRTGSDDRECADLFFIGGLNWKTDVGTIENGKPRVKYTAPATAKTPVATVTLPFAILTTLRVLTEVSPQKDGELVAHIMIAQPYKVSGQNGPVVYSGTICSLWKPFEVTVTNAFMKYNINFEPMLKDPPTNTKPRIYSTRYDPSKGKFSYVTTMGQLHMSGQGTYVVQDWSTDHPTIVCNEQSEAHGPMGIGSSGRGVATIQLTPLETSECNGK